MEGYLASWGFLITKAGSIPTAVSALRPSKGVGKGPVPRPSRGAGVKEARPPVELCVPRRQPGGLSGTGTGSHYQGQGLVPLHESVTRLERQRIKELTESSGSVPREVRGCTGHTWRGEQAARIPPALPGEWGAHT